MIYRKVARSPLFPISPSLSLFWQDSKVHRRIRHTPGPPSAGAGIVCRYDLPQNQFMFPIPGCLGARPTEALYHNPTTPLQCLLPPAPLLSSPLFPTLTSKPSRQFFPSFPFLFYCRLCLFIGAIARGIYQTDLATLRIVQAPDFNFRSLRLKERKA